MAIASRQLSRLRQRTQELKAQEQTLQRETETLKRETEMLKAQEQALKSETETLKAQEQTLQHETEMLKNLLFTIESEKPTTPKKEHITLNSLLSSNRTEVSRTANLVFNVPFSRMNETMRLVILGTAGSPTWSSAVATERPVARRSPPGKGGRKND